MTSRFSWKTAASNLAVISKTNLCFDDQVRKLYRWNLSILGWPCNGNSCFYIPFVYLATLFTSVALRFIYLVCKDLITLYKVLQICKRHVRIFLTLGSTNWLLVHFEAVLLKQIVVKKKKQFPLKADVLTPQQVSGEIWKWMDGYSKCTRLLSSTTNSTHFEILLITLQGSCLAADNISTHVGLWFVSREISMVSKGWKRLRRRTNIIG